MPCISSKANHKVGNPSCSTNCCEVVHQSSQHTKLCKCINENDKIFKDTINCLLDQTNDLIQIINPNSLSLSQVGSTINQNDDTRIGSAIDFNNKGDIIAVGSSSSLSNTSTVTVFQYNGSEWSQLGNKLSRTSDDSPIFGFSVSLNNQGDILAIGSPNDSGPFTGAGRVDIYRYDKATNIWSLQLNDTILGTVVGDFLGFSVSLSADGNRLAIGSPFMNPEVRIYEYNGTTWNLFGTPISGFGSDVIGSRVDLNDDGTIIVVGDSTDDTPNTNNGRAYVFRHDGSDWAQLGGDLIGDETTDSNFGSDVSINAVGDIVAVGGQRMETTSDVGGVKVFRFDGTSWRQIGSTIFGEQFDARFGNNIELDDSGTRLVVGAPRGGPVLSAGYVKLYYFNGANWAQVGQTIYGQGQDDLFGTGVSINGDGTRIAGGTATEDANPGYVQIYDVENPLPCLEEQTTKINF